MQGFAMKLSIAAMLLSSQIASANTNVAPADFINTKAGCMSCHQGASITPDAPIIQKPRMHAQHAPHKIKKSEASTG